MRRRTRLYLLHCCAKFLFFKLETSNFGSSYVFSSPLKWEGGGRILPNLTFWTQKWHILGVRMSQNLKSLTQETPFHPIFGPKGLVLVRQGWSETFWRSSPVLKDLNLLGPLAHYHLDCNANYETLYQRNGLTQNYAELACCTKLHCIHIYKLTT